MRIIYSPQAISDLERLHQFLAGKSLPAASEAASKILGSIEHVKRFPLSGRPTSQRPDVRDAIITLSHGAYILRYQITKEVVRILRVWHAREDYPRGTS